MWMPGSSTITAPDGDVIALDDVKEFLRVDDASQDTSIGDAVSDAVGHIEAYTGTRLLTQTVKVRASGFDDIAHLPIGPVQSVAAVEYLASDGSTVTLDPAAYEEFGADLERGIRPAFGSNWPAIRGSISDAVRVSLVVGYGTAADIPGPIRRALLLLIGDYYTSREDTVVERSVTPTTLPNGVDTQLSNFRIYG